ncbi:hypothetical protein FGO68_gene16 [Halteria grandinella]|uniref:Uncharacterized protein n=1 Tax=Halteria grandinella TaxID=5974 RepID=A0A8J8P409_HALGN|nr:hypothetical protein FGO68_gene16 [Halteria grandinella]
MPLKLIQFEKRELNEHLIPNIHNQYNKQSCNLKQPQNNRVTQFTKKGSIVRVNCLISDKSHLRLSYNIC